MGKQTRNLNLSHMRKYSFKQLSDAFNADRCTFQRVAMRLIVDQSLATDFNTRQQRVLLPFKPGVLERKVLIDFSLTVKVATLIFISRPGSAISSAKEGKSNFIFNLVKS